MEVKEGLVGFVTMIFSKVIKLENEYLHINRYEVCPGTIRPKRRV